MATIKRKTHSRKKWGWGCLKSTSKAAYWRQFVHFFCHSESGTVGRRIHQYLV